MKDKPCLVVNEKYYDILSCVTNKCIKISDFKSLYALLNNETAKEVNRFLIEFETIGDMDKYKQSIIKYRTE